ncbi:probable LRR receptor-like serine/threonine-protein kinase at1g56130 [Phtheirospermum japonicum]|uniref:non-specific serine/threonine protein kinase n=1 Tax=Phtheirospermum japonicum TaxID=374723 RepID=A0A830CSE5_9LAMI|nr:probable LRR receptor-like serine/threonine-protein kinase at1g56130 [Phtheirospermum japonicum]
MGLLSFSLFALWMLQIVAAQPKTVHHEVVAIKKIIDHWGLRSKLNLSVDPCIPNATWAPQNANPRIAYISGEIPQELFNLTELMDLNLDQNVLNGSIPRAMGKLSKMQYLALGINNFTGPVPAELGNLTKLIVLSFSSNSLQGTLPPELGKLTSLQQLWASDNNFTGKIPEFLKTFTDLKVLRLEGTSLEGPIPRSFGVLTKMEDLRIGDLGGIDSSLDFLENMTSLSTLSLRNCQIGGQIPEQLSSFPNLQSLDLSFNKLTGQIPASFKNFSSLQYLYLGSNSLNGDLPSDIISSTLIALDVSFNPLTGTVPVERKDISINVVGTSINDANLNNKKAAASFAVNSGGPQQISADGTKYEDDSEILGAASSYISPDNEWAVSSTGAFISNPNGPRYIAETDSQITNTLDSELHKTARITPNSLRYYGLGLENGIYQIELHFAEIQMDDSSSNSWKSLGRRLFDVYVQGDRVLQDFNILNEAGGSKKALIKKFKANVTNTVLDIHLKWAGKGTCCIPFQSTYGPLISAVRVSQVSKYKDLSESNSRIGRTLGIAIGCAVGLLIICTVLYLWCAKKEAGHMRIQTDSRKD